MVSVDKIKGQLEYAKKQREQARTEGDWTKFDNLAKKLHRAYKGLPKEKDEEESTEEETTSTANTNGGLKTQYGACVKPKYRKVRITESVEEKIGCFEEIAFITEEKFVDYNSRTKIATLYEGADESSKLRVTNSDWVLSWEQVVDQLGGIES